MAKNFEGSVKEHGREKIFVPLWGQWVKKEIGLVYISQGLMLRS